MVITIIKTIIIHKITNFYSDITYEDTTNHLAYKNSQKQLKFSHQDEVLSKTIYKSFQNQKLVKEFLNESEKKKKWKKILKIEEIYDEYER